MGKHAGHAVLDSFGIAAAGEDRRLYGYLQLLHRAAGAARINVLWMDHESPAEKQSAGGGACRRRVHGAGSFADAASRGSWSRENRGSGSAACGCRGDRVAEDRQVGTLIRTQLQAVSAGSRA